MKLWIKILNKKEALKDIDTSQMKTTVMSMGERWRNKNFLEFAKRILTTFNVYEIFLKSFNYNRFVGSELLTDRFHETKI